MYYEVKVKIVNETASGKGLKHSAEFYLVDAMSVTEAEARVHKDFQKDGSTLDYEVTDVKKARVCKVIEADR